MNSKIIIVILSVIIAVLSLYIYTLTSDLNSAGLEIAEHSQSEKAMEDELTIAYDFIYYECNLSNFYKFRDETIETAWREKHNETHYTT